MIPRAWQEFWAPVGRLPAAKRIWDARTVELCPTSHRNVHFWIVKLMKTRAGEDPLNYKKAVWGSGRLTREQSLAYTTLCRWKEAGGSLTALCQEGLWGEA